MSSTEPSGEDNMQTQEKKESPKNNSVPVPPPPPPPTAQRLTDSILSFIMKTEGTDFPNSHSLNRSQMNSILEGLKSENEYQTFNSLQDLCEMLSMSTEDSLASFRVDSFGPALVNLLQYDLNPEIMLYAARCLTYLMESLPSSCSSIVHYGAVPMFCSKLLSIEFIDLAEQSLQALEKLSVEHPASVLRAGGLEAVLSYLDFFSSGVKRAAVTTAANICRRVPSDCFQNVLPVIPILTDLLNDQDAKVVENSCICFVRLTESFCESEAKLNQIASPMMISHLTRMLSNPSSIPTSTTNLVLRLLTAIAHGSSSLTLSLLQEGIAPILKSLILLSESSQSMSRSPEFHSEILSLINELLPPLPKEVCPPLALKSKFQSRITPSSLRKKKPEEEEVKQPDAECRLEMIKKYPHLVANLNEVLFENLIKIFNSTAFSPIQHKCLSSITKLIYFSTPEALYDLLKSLAMSSFIATLLSSRDLIVVATAIKIAEILMQKLPNIFEYYFRREGVIYEIERLVTSVNKHKDSTTPTIFKKGETPTSPSTTTTTTTTTTSIPNPSLSQSLGIPSSNPQGIPSSPSISITNLSTSSPTSVPSSPQPSSSQFLSSPSPDSFVLSSSPSIPTSTDEIKVWIETQSRNFSDFYSRIRNNNETNELDILCTIKKDLVKFAKSQVHDEEEELKVLTKLRSLFEKEDGVSVFEIKQSKIVSGLLRYLLSDDFEGEREKRLRVFCEGFTMKTSSQAVVTFVHKLQETLNALEKFPVLLYDTTAHNSGLNFLTQPLKLKPLRLDNVEHMSDERELKDYSAPFIHVEPLATIHAIEEFLWQRVKPPIIPAPSIPTSSPKATGPSLSSSTSSSYSSSSSSLHKKESVLVPFPPTPPSLSKSLSASANALKSSKSDSPRQNEEGTTDPLEADNEFFDDLEEYEADETLASDNEAGRVHDVLLDEHRKSELGLDSSQSESLSSSSRPSPAPTPSPSLAKTSVPQPNLKLSIKIGDGEYHPLTDTHLTIFQYIQKIACEQLQNGSVETCQPPHKMWETIYTLTYQRAEVEDEALEEAVPVVKVHQVKSTPFENFVEEHFPKDSNNPLLGDSQNVLSLLKLLHAILSNTYLFIKDGSENSGTVGPAFINEKLTSKLLRQLQDPLSLCTNSLPDWCRLLTHNFSFLFPYDCRRFFFYSTSFGISRALQTLQQRNELGLGESGETLRINRLQRQKVRVHRDRVLESAIKVMHLFGKQKPVLEVEYFEEVGTGLGPTLEFYTLVCQELQQKDLNLWIDEERNQLQKNQQSPSTDVEMVDADIQQKENNYKKDKKNNNKEGKYVWAPQGLFPAPVQGDVHGQVRAIKRMNLLFRFMGVFVAKALLDNRLLDLPLSEPFLKTCLGHHLSYKDLPLISHSNKFIPQIVHFSQKKAMIYSQTSDKAEQRKTLEAVEFETFKGKLEDICLTFVLPGFPEYELKENGSNIEVTADNVDEYVELVVDAFLKKGVESQVANFQDGFNSVFPLENLQLFTPSEVDLLLSGLESNESWDLNTLMDNIKCDHGYSQGSRAVEYLLEIMAELDNEDRRHFLRFVTGSPRLPIGGFKNLNPKFTIVRKDQHSPDDFLPSVSSCFHFLKLPDYSSKQVMKEKLLYAIRSGQGSFHLT
eukprot:TRINITY_DN481_c1_g1_i1.p1 TRINITY_DN481_c1_g1~~TRINITY_DN481_c1_g1_i1.p1  ORF type:complete len:1638 (-),score=371.48 TRINITY_DN481_c1_g1_i1:6-4919(-)